eukprot:CAMPEP_0119568428 /NCGR_PEP_ID=MMETSP1352-20130426/38848_1 /TAXON_ID=265584 /ORGANISM="Stauroneis constricta, Strain CCMP1120" /LENGTH=63 /DNA_ID=CAMNT_0007617825 /DNA_START=129 /DNA_END=316 /DNA_ORIENTATION=-
MAMVTVMFMVVTVIMAMRVIVMLIAVLVMLLFGRFVVAVVATAEFVVRNGILQLIVQFLYAIS